MKAKLAILAVAVASLAGCSTAVTRRADRDVASAHKEASGLLAKMHAGTPLVRRDTVDAGVHKIDAPWIPVSRVDEKKLREERIVDREVTVNRHFTGVDDAAAYITSLTGIPVTVSAAAEKAVAAASATKAAGGAARGVLPPPPAMAARPMPGIPGMGGLLPPSPLEQDTLISYSGKLSGLLDVVVARYNLFWEVGDDGGIRLFKTKSETFRLVALPGDSSMESKVGTQAASSGSGGGAGVSGPGGAGGAAQTVSTATSNAEQSSGIKFSGLSVWSAIENSIKTMLTADGKVVVTPATGTVTVDDTPPTLEKVAEFIKEQNAALRRQVLINVRVLSVQLNNADQYGIDWNAIYKNVAGGQGLGFASPSGITGTGSLSFNIVNTGHVWDGTKLMLQALSQQGRVSQITSASIVTINNQPAPLQVGKQTSYLASSMTTLGVSGSGNTTTLQPGVISTGFTMSVLPHILSDSKLLLQYSASISALDSISTVTSGGSSIQTPQIDTRNFLQRVMIGNGDTLVLTGFEQVGATDTKQGIGSAENTLLGGSVNGGGSKNIIVVLIQPVLGSAD